MLYETRPDDGKLKELIIYISQISEGDDTYGATKLNKLLFFADFIAYRNFGRSITGHEYQKLPQGPAPRRLLPIQREMQELGEIAIRENGYFRYRQKRTVPLREADLSMFTPEEIDLVNRLVNKWRNQTAQAISEFSHRFRGWCSAEEGETIPYEVALIGDRQPSAEEIEYGRSLEVLAGECVGG